MLLLIASMALADPASAAFPERTPGLIEACLLDAIKTGDVSDTDDSHKYICSGETAQQLWAFLKKARIGDDELDVGAEGHWSGRYFPLGGCFKRIRLADGSPAKTGLSCTIWIPRPAP
ncbi:MAG TPA: hypothetical protein VE053_00650 [Allosphingosinicella sp.]|nr:hypothetical protein [Allosphingosinicella sp.]